MKRILSMFLAVCISLTVALLPMKAYASGYDSRYVIIEENSDGESLKVKDCKPMQGGHVNLTEPYYKPITVIGYNAFLYCDDITSIALPDTVTTIEYSAFECCFSLTSINIPDSVSTIEEAAFRHCRKLPSITIPGSVKNISESLFEDCTKLTDVSLGEGITDIGNFAFNDCSSLSSITLPDSVNSIGNYAFDDCNSLTSIKLPDTMSSIGRDAFSGCTQLTSIAIPSGITYIERSTFEDCTNLSSVIIPESVTNVEPYAFNNCRNLRKVHFLGAIFDYDLKVYSSNKPFLEADWHFDVQKTQLNGTTIYSCSECGLDFYQDGSVAEKYTVTFKNEDGTVLSEDSYFLGEEVLVPAAPTKEADNIYTYTFAGWDKPVVNCAGNTTYTATYKSDYIPYTVTFQYADGTPILISTYHYGDTVTEPEAPRAKEEGYSFTGWDREIVSCTGDAVYTAVFKEGINHGDVNGDGKINSLDGLLLMRYLNGWNANIASPEAMDVNGDGKVNSLDGLILMRYLNGWNVTLG